MTLAATPDPVEVLTAGGLQHATALVAAARRAGLPLHIAAALIEKESGGRNVYGGDAGGKFSQTPRLPVTASNYAEFTKAVAAGHRSNGVGPAQITYPAYFPQAGREGLKLWEPEDNMAFGFRIFAANLAACGGRIDEAGVLFNSGNLRAGVTTYGRDLVARSAAWLDRLETR